MERPRNRSINADLAVGITEVVFDERDTTIRVGDWGSPDADRRGAKSPDSIEFEAEGRS